MHKHTQKGRLFHIKPASAGFFIYLFILSLIVGKHLKAVVMNLCSLLSYLNDIFLYSLLLSNQMKNMDYCPKNQKQK